MQNQILESDRSTGSPPENSALARNTGPVLLLLATLLLFSLPSITHASGSYSTGGGGANQSYHLGKKAFHQKLNCSACPLAEMEVDAGQAEQIIQRLSGSEEFADILTVKDREVIIAYLKRRYRL